MPQFTTHSTAAFVCCLLLVLGILAPADAVAQQTSLAKLNPGGEARISESYGKLPLSFEVNKGQADRNVRFLTHGSGYALSLNSTEAVLTLARGSHVAQSVISPSERAETEDGKSAANDVLKIKLIGANPVARCVGLEELSGKSSYFIGNDPTQWQSNISNYAKVKIEDIYPGIDLVYYGKQHVLEYDWIVAPGADPNAIRFNVEKSEKLKLDGAGNLVLDGAKQARRNSRDSG
jgi:hypothetical protein